LETKGESEEALKWAGEVGRGGGEGGKKGQDKNYRDTNREKRQVAMIGEAYVL